MSNWVDFTRRNDPAQPYYVEKLRRNLDKYGYPDVLCFWTKAPQNIYNAYHDLIVEMQDNGTLVLAQPTINGYTELEPGVTDEMAQIGDLVSLLGPECVRLRFDPIICGYTTPAHFHKTLMLAHSHGISRIITNFLVPSYKGVGKTLKSMGIRVIKPSVSMMEEILEGIVERASVYDIQIQGCAEIYKQDVFVDGLVVAGCSDSQWATDLRPELSFKQRPSRPGCLCCYSSDWGEYSNRSGPPCPHQCVYCYAK